MTILIGLFVITRPISENIKVHDHGNNNNNLNEITPW
jgi:hypothetical protein